MQKLLKISLFLLFGILLNCREVAYCGKISVQKHLAEEEDLRSKARTEGVAWGKEHFQKQCLEEAIFRARKCSSESDSDCLSKIHYFLEESLYVAKPTKHFCKNILGLDNLSDAISWRAEQCLKLAPDLGDACPPLLIIVQVYCKHPNS